MKDLRRILFPTDFSRCANQTLSLACNLAKRYNAELHMLHGAVLHEDDPYHVAYHVPNIEEVHNKIRLTAFEEMSSLMRAYHTNGLKVVKAQERGIATAPTILNYANERDIDLIVMGTHGRRGLGHLFLGSVAEEVVRLAKQPVLTVREQKEPKPSEGLRRVLVPLDFSEHSKTALAYAKEVAVAYEADLQLLHVVEQSIHPSFYVTGQISIFEFAPEIKEKSQHELKQLLEEMPGPALKADYHVIEGRANRDIVRFAKDYGSDLIVIATHGLTGIEHLLVGSVTEKVVRLAHCPVLTVQSFGKSLI